MPRTGGRSGGGGGSRSGGGGGRSSGGGGRSIGGGGGVVHVSGYTRANGTYVAGYTRSSPGGAGASRSRSSSSSSSAGRSTTSGYSSVASPVSTSGTGLVHVRGYTRSDGTHVAGYTRSSPGGASRSRSASSSSSAGRSTTSGYSSVASPMSTSGTGLVHVRDYTRSDGTHVAGYTRSSPGGASRSREASSSSSAGRNTTGDYSSVASPMSTSSTLSSGLANLSQWISTKVASYMGASPKPTSKPPSATSASFDAPDTVHVSGYTRADGKYVAEYTRSKPGTSSQSQSSIASATSTDENVVHVKSHTRADGVHVHAHTRSLPGTKSDIDNGSKSSGEKRYYVDNAFNRKHNRVGWEVGTCVISKKPTAATSSGQKEVRTTNTAAKNEKKQRFYVDNPQNRHLGRVGKPIPSRKGLKKKLMEEKTLEELHMLIRNLQFARPEPDLEYEYALENAVNDMEREEVEEKWRRMRVEPETNITQLSQIQMHSKIIPFSELQLEQEPIGRGGFGEVYAAMWHNTPVAFKKFHRQHMSKRNKESFEMEIIILASLNRPNIVRMFGAVIEVGNIGIVMEYMHCSLFHAIFINETEFSDYDKKSIVSQMVDAVHYLHTHDPKIAHCDIKSENVLLDKNNNAKLTDFGLSTMKNDTESTRSNQGAVPPGRGTPRYSAPEILRGELLRTDQLFPADIYSLSIVVFEVIVEEEPFPGLSVRQMEENVGRGSLRPTLPVAVTRTVENLLKRCWNDSAYTRPTADEFQRIWRGIIKLYSDC